VRTVHRLQLVGHDLPSTQRAIGTLHEAFRLASLEDGRQRRLIVRRLELGAFSESATPAALSAEITRRVRALHSSAVHIAQRHAASADAVWFRDDVDASLVLLDQVAGARGWQSWFWPSAVGGLRLGSTPRDAVRLAFRQLLGAPHPRRSLALAVDTLIRARRAPMLLDTLEVAEAGALLDRLSSSDVAGAESSSTVDREGPLDGFIARHPWRSVLVDSVARWGAADPRAVWLCWLALGFATYAERPASLPRARVLARALLRSPTLSKPEPRVAGVAAPSAGDTGVGADMDAISREALQRAAIDRGAASPVAQPVAAGAAQLQHAEPLASGLAGASPQPQPAAARETSVHAREEDVAATSTLGAAGPNEPADRPRSLAASGVSFRTECGGVFFLTAALARLGMREFLAAHPFRTSLPWRVLQRVLDDLGVSAKDDLRALIAVAAAEPLGGAELVAPAAWWAELRRGEVCHEGRAADAVAFVDEGGLALALWSAERQPLLAQSGPYRPRPASTSAVATREVVVDAWCVALQRWLEAWCEASLAEIVLRPATLQYTRTHLDLFFLLRDADVRIRRVALDVDPGYVPWLGYVLTFHML